MARPIHLPEEARFSCQNCGRCCQGWAVPVEQSAVERLRAHDWGGEPFEPPRVPGEPHRIKLIRDRCFFLDEANRCRIHTELSYEAKPAACRAYPLTVLEVDGRRYARLSFWCPTVTANSGRPLGQQGRWLAETAKHSDRRTAPVLLSRAAPIVVEGLELVHQALKRLLQRRELSVSERLAAAGGLVHRLVEAHASSGGRIASVRTIVQAVEADAPARVEGKDRLADPAAGWRLLLLYLMQDRSPGRLAAVRRFTEVLLFNARLTKLSCRSVSGRASRRRVGTVAFKPSSASIELLTRYLSSKLDSKRYLAGDATLVSGVNLLVSAYGLINLLARLRAASERRDHCDDQDVRRAVGAADLLAIEHPGFYQGRAQLQRRLVEAALESVDLSADILAAVGDA